MSKNRPLTMNQRILRLAVPNIVSNITVPLLGMVDLAIVGHLGGKHLLAAVAIGVAMFNLLYWNFGFLRMGTSGFTAQAYGRRDFADAFRTLYRALIVAVGIALLMILLQVPLRMGILALMDGSAEVERLAMQYFHILIWAAPATLSLYAFNGWFIGMQNAKTPMYISIMVNIINIILAFTFAVGLDMKLVGIALGTATAQWSGALVSAFIVWRSYGRLHRKDYLKEILRRADLTKFFKVNSDIFLRTLCLVIVFTFFTSASSSMGDTVLAANALMMQLFTLFSYIMDGFAYSGEALAGRYYGARDKVMLRKTVKGIFKWGALFAIMFTAVYALFGESILGIFSDDADVIAMTNQYIGWGVAIPLIAFSAFLMDGILVGMGQATLMRNTMLLASALFFTLYYSLVGVIGNNALWLSFVIFLGLRGVFQFIAGHRRSFF